MDPHRLAELRSIALHEAVARELVRNPEIVETGRRRVASLHAEGKIAAFYRDAWLAVLDLPIERLVVAICEDSEQARALRQTTPFAGVVAPRERGRIWRAVRESA